MESLFTKSNMAAAGLSTLAVMFALQLTAGKSKLVSGAVAFGAALGALQLAKKI